MSTDMTTPIDYDALIELISSDAIDANDFASQAVEAIRALRAAAVESEQRIGVLIAENSKIWGWFTEMAQHPAARAAQEKAP